MRKFSSLLHCEGLYHQLVYGEPDAKVVVAPLPSYLVIENSLVLPKASNQVSAYLPSIV